MKQKEGGEQRENSPKCLSNRETKDDPAGSGGGSSC